LVSFSSFGCAAELAVQIGVGAVIYVALLWGFKDRDVQEFAAAGREFLKKRKSRE